VEEVEEENKETGPAVAGPVVPSNLHGGGSGRVVSTCAPRPPHILRYMHKNFSSSSILIADLAFHYDADPDPVFEHTNWCEQYLHTYRCDRFQSVAIHGRKFNFDTRILFVK